VPFRVATVVVLLVFGEAKTEGRPNARRKPKFDGCPWPEANDKMQMDTVNIATGIPQHNQRVVLFTMSAEQCCPRKMAPKFHEQMFPVCLGQLIQNCMFFTSNLLKEIWEKLSQKCAFTKEIHAGLLCLGAVAISPLGVMPPLMLFAASLAPVCLPLLLREASRFWLLLQLLWLCALASGLAFCLAFWIANVLQGELDALAVFALIFVAINLLLCLLW